MVLRTPTQPRRTFYCSAQLRVGRCKKIQTILGCLRCTPPFVALRSTTNAATRTKTWFPNCKHPAFSFRWFLYFYDEREIQEITLPIHGRFNHRILYFFPLAFQQEKQQFFVVCVEKEWSRVKECYWWNNKAVDSQMFGTFIFLLFNGISYIEPTLKHNFKFESCIII